jgi:hypothetical protein
MAKLSLICEELLNENPNQAIKFLKEWGLDPENGDGKQMLDAILGITRGDGYTAMLTKFYVRRELSLDQIKDTYEQIKQNKFLLSRLPKPIVSYEYYSELQRDATLVYNEYHVNWLLKQLSKGLREQYQRLTTEQRKDFQVLASDFHLMSEVLINRFMSKVFGFKNIDDFMKNLQGYIKAGGKELPDYNKIKEKILSTQGAHLAYDDQQKGILIAYISSYSASQTLGCTTAWCISRDIANYKDWKAGGKKYFFIWDVNYPESASEFFIATAFDTTFPEKSKTHEHIDDNSLNLGSVLTDKGLSFDIFKNFLQTFVNPDNSDYEYATEFMAALRAKDRDKIAEIIGESETMRELQHNEIFVTRNGGTVELGITSDEMKSIFGLGEEYDYMERLANDDYGSNSYDSDDSNYMHNGLNEENMNLLVDLAKKLGLSKKVYGKFKSMEGAIRKFLEKWGLDEIVDTYVSEYGEAEYTAEQEAAAYEINKIPFNVDNASFDIDTVLEYYRDNELTAKTFDELIEQIKAKLPSFEYDTISEYRYINQNLDKLNREINYKLELITDDPDSEHYERFEIFATAYDYLSKLRFKLLYEHKKVAEFNSRQSTIVINQIIDHYEDPETPVIMVIATIYAEGADGRKVRIPLTSLPKYIDQPELSLQEHLRRMKSLMIIK